MDFMVIIFIVLILKFTYICVFNMEVFLNNFTQFLYLYFIFLYFEDLLLYPLLNLWNQTVSEKCVFLFSYWVLF